jgi:hypothetical protein
MIKLPVYFNCYFFDKKSEKSAYTYKIEESKILEHPFQLFKLVSKAGGEWQNLSVYVSVDDAIKILLRELFSKELIDEVYHGQAVINPSEILEKINRGERSVSIYGSTNNEAFRLEFDVVFEDLVERN